MTATPRRRRHRFLHRHLQFGAGSIVDVSIHTAIVIMIWHAQARLPILRALFLSLYPSALRSRSRSLSLSLSLSFSRFLLYFRKRRLLYTNRKKKKVNFCRGWLQLLCSLFLLRRFQGRRAYCFYPELAILAATTLLALFASAFSRKPRILLLS